MAVVASACPMNLWLVRILLDGQLAFLLPPVRQAELFVTKRDGFQLRKEIVWLSFPSAPLSLLLRASGVAFFFEQLPTFLARCSASASSAATAMAQSSRGHNIATA